MIAENATIAPTGRLSMVVKIQDSYLNDNTQTLISVLRELFRRVSNLRRRQLGLLILFMSASACAEVITIGAVLPFLAIIAAPDQMPNWANFAIFAEMGMPERVSLLGSILIIAAIATMIMRSALLWYSQIFVMGLGQEIARSIFARMLRQPYSYYLESHSSSVLSGMEKTQIVVLGVMQPAVQAISSTAIAISIFAALLWLSPVAALSAGGIAIGLYVCLGLASRGMLQRNSSELANISKARIRAVQEGLGGIRDILLENSQPVFEKQFSRLDSQFYNVLSINNFVASAPRFVFEGVAITAVALVAIYMAGTREGLISAIPILGALALAAQRLLPLVQQAYLGFSNAMGNLQSLRDVVSLMQEPLAQMPSSSAKPLAFNNAITFDNVSFHYADGEPVLCDLSMSIRKGQRIGVIGRTGAGKSSLFDLVMGLLEPTKGEIRIDDQILDRNTRRGWQAQIAHVPQSIFLLDDSIAVNIAFGIAKDEIDMNRVSQAARAAGLIEFISGLPQGFASMVGERGVRISGGQKQRIGIARALYKSPSVLILDEATSALDIATETAVLNAILDLDSDMTILMIAHRHATLERCDTVFELIDGKLTISGG